MASVLESYDDWGEPLQLVGDGTGSLRGNFSRWVFYFLDATRRDEAADKERIRFAVSSELEVARAERANGLDNSLDARIADAVNQAAGLKALAAFDARYRRRAPETSRSLNCFPTRGCPR